MVVKQLARVALVLTIAASTIQSPIRAYVPSSPKTHEHSAKMHPATVPQSVAPIDPFGESSLQVLPRLKLPALPPMAAKTSDTAKHIDLFLS